jgi:hypothetical protein
MVDRPVAACEFCESAFVTFCRASYAFTLPDGRAGGIDNQVMFSLPSDSLPGLVAI